MRFILCVLLLCACGRIGYDALEVDPGSEPDSAEPPVDEVIPCTGRCECPAGVECTFRCDVSFCTLECASDAVCHMLCFPGRNCSGACGGGSCFLDCDQQSCLLTCNQGACEVTPD